MKKTAGRERVCVYPGSFDPPTRGHLELIRRAAALYDRVIVAVAVNPDKKGCFSPEEREALLQECTASLSNVEVDRFSGLTVQYARDKGACALLRGLRSAADFDPEWHLAQINRSICPEVETVFLMSSPALAHVSSSAVREMAAFGADFGPYLPDEIVSHVRAHFEPYQPD